MLVAVAMMNALEPPDLHHLRAASGWLLLGNDVEANEDLERINPKLRAHPDVLEIRWQICAKAKKWDACLDIASAIVETDPDRPSGWISLAYSLRQVGGEGLQAAFNILLSVAERFPAEPMIPFSLACCASQMGQLADACHWLRKAFAAAHNSGRNERLRSMALDDPELEALLKEIGEL